MKTRINPRYEYIIWIVIILFCTLVGLTSCVKTEEKVEWSNKHELRQLNKNTETRTSSSGSFFLVVGGYGSMTHEHTTIQMYALIKGNYTFLEYNLTDVRIRIDSSVQIPYVQRHYEYHGPKNMTQNTFYSYNEDYILITCSEEYLPEQLLPIRL